MGKAPAWFMERVREDVSRYRGHQGPAGQGPAWTRLLQDSEDKDTGFAVSLWESAAEMQAYEQSDLYRQDIAPALQPFFVGDYKTYRSEVKYVQ